MRAATRRDVSKLWENILREGVTETGLETQGGRDAHQGGLSTGKRARQKEGLALGRQHRTLFLPRGQVGSE